MNLPYHLILTRFNVRTDDQTWSDRWNDDWMKNRLELFQRYCFPSVCRQAKAPTAWIVYFDRERSLPYLDRITEFRRVFPLFRPIYIDHISEHHCALEEHLQFTDMPVITTRLDNDDVLHPRFVQDIHEAVLNVVWNGPSVPYVIDFPNTNFWDIRTNSVQKTFYRDATAFASLVEYPKEWADFRGVLSVPHQDLKKRFGLVRYLPEVRTMAVVHGRNLANGVAPRGVRSALMRLLIPSEENWLSSDETRAILTEFGVVETSVGRGNTL